MKLLRMEEVDLTNHQIGLRKSLIQYPNLLLLI
jgi:hypothetical protein